MPIDELRSARRFDPSRWSNVDRPAGTSVPGIADADIPPLAWWRWLLVPIQLLMLVCILAWLWLTTEKPAYVP